jgi:2-dehydro-3-deoxyphosphogluconate aldolase/(4S)-4-hydroxy-2-oxoglutarate aldolase
VAVVTIENPHDAVPLAHSLLAGGVSSIELTFRPSAAPEAIRRFHGEVPEVLIGAGSILNRAQLELARKSAALFAVAPCCNPSTLRAARELNLPFAPGVATPSEIEIAVENGCQLLKFFPAETCVRAPPHNHGLLPTWDYAVFLLAVSAPVSSAPTSNHRWSDASAVPG